MREEGTGGFEYLEGIVPRHHQQHSRHDARARLPTTYLSRFRKTDERHTWEAVGSLDAVFLSGVCFVWWGIPVRRGALPKRAKTAKSFCFEVYEVLYVCTSYEKKCNRQGLYPASPSSLSLSLPLSLTLSGTESPSHSPAG